MQSLLLCSLQVLVHLPVIMQSFLCILQMSLWLPSAVLWAIANPFDEELPLDAFLEFELPVDEDALNFILKLTINGDGHGWDGCFARSVCL